MKMRSIIGLDLIRFAAAFAVMWFHLAYYTWASRQSPSGLITSGLVEYRSLAPTAWFGWVGVHVFFVISGFVIAFSAREKDAIGFAKSRFLRLYPAVWICATVTLLFLIVLGEHESLARKYLASITLFPLRPWVDAVYWTLGVEIAFYGLIFLLLLWGSFRYLPHLLSVVGLLSSALWIFWALGVDFPLLRETRPAELLLFTYGCHFALGGLIWMASAALLPRSLYVTTGICFLGGAIGVYSLSDRTDHSPFIPVAVWAISVVLIVASVVWNTRISTWLESWRNVVRLIGLATYPLYLLHDVPGASIIRWLRMIGCEQHLALATSMALVTLMSFIVAGVLEPRLKRVVDDCLKARFPLLVRTADRVEGPSP